MSQSLNFKKQKSRKFIKFKYPALKFGTAGIISLSSGYINLRMVCNFLLKFKKVFKLNKSVSRF